jgi:uncharacterized protein (DUF697 family)/GTP-binding protein EngB required for normal cell division
MKEYSQEAVEQEIRDMLAEMKVPNVLICGQTGAGKSSAINYLFKSDVALVGNTGEPCTQDITLKKGTAINIYDSEGYEIGGEKQSHYKELIFDDFLSKPVNQKIGGVHLVWYAISAAGKRYTDTDIAIIKEIAAHYHVCILLTKIDELAEDKLEKIYTDLKNEISDLEVFRLSIDSNEAVQKYCDWDKLVTWSCSMLEPVYRDRFVSGVRASLEEKRKQAHAAVALATAAAAAVGASPIPFSDAALLIPIQSGMILRILNLYGIKLAEGSISSLLSSVGLSALGKAATGNLFKLIPGVGTWVGATINASVAGLFTTAIGMVLTEMCHKQCQDMLDGKEIIFDLEKVLSSQSFFDSIKEYMQKGKIDG